MKDNKKKFEGINFRNFYRNENFRMKNHIQTILIENYLTI